MRSRPRIAPARRARYFRHIAIGIGALTCAAAAGAQSLPLDVDGNGKVDPYTDVVFVERFLLGLPPVPPSMRATNPSLPSDEVIAARIQAIAGTPQSTPTSVATPTATASGTRTVTATATLVPTNSRTVTATATATEMPTQPASTATISGTPTTSPTVMPTPRIMEGADVVRGSAEVAAQNVESVTVLDFGCVSAHCSGGAQPSGFRLGVGRRTAMHPQGATTNGAPPSCMTSTCQTSLQNGAQVGVQTINYDHCTETTASGHTIVRNGTTILTVSNPAFCGTMKVQAVSDTVTLQLQGYTQVERDSSNDMLLQYAADLTDTFDPDQEGCTPKSPGQDAPPAIDGTQVVDGTVSYLCVTGAESMPCPRGATNLALSPRHLQIKRQSGGFPCELGMTMNGELGVDDQDHKQNGDPCRAQFAQRFEAFFIAEAPQDDGTTTVREDGKLSVDALGDLLFATKKDDPTGTAPPGTSGSFAFAASAHCPDGGDGKLEVTRPPMVVDGGAALAATERAVIAGQQATEFRHQLYRATNGQVYQVLQNVDDFSSFGADAIQVTTLIGSEAGGVGQCSFTAGATVEPQAVAAVEPGKAFPPSEVRKSGIIPYDTQPIFNRNGSGGNGMLCIGPDCVGPNGACPPSGACATFTVQDGMPISVPTSGIPAANLVDALPAFRNTIGCIGFKDLSTYRFGSNGPTVEVRQCSVFPEAPTGNGFRIPNRQSVVFVYNASFASLFNAAAAGFPIDIDGNNLIGCDVSGNRVLHLGVATLDSVEAPIIRFGTNGTDPTTSFDFLGDGTQTQTVRGCVGISPLCK